MKNDSTESLLGCCGLYCGLCSKYQSTAPSRCVGCGPGEQHSWCSIWNCCTKKHELRTCAECSDIFTCDVFVRRKVGEWVPAAGNLGVIKEIGPEVFVVEQQKRQRLLEELLENYNEGRSMSLYCKACARLPVASVERVLEETRKRIKKRSIDPRDKKSMADAAKALLKDLALQAGIDLK